MKNKADQCSIIKVFFFILLLPLLAFLLARLLFLGINKTAVQNIPPEEFFPVLIYGLRFDLLVSWGFACTAILFYIIYCRSQSGLWKRVLSVYWIVGTFSFLFLSLADVLYYSKTFRRLNLNELLEVFQNRRLAGAVLLEDWQFFVLALVFLIAIYWLHRILLNRVYSAKVAGKMGWWGMFFIFGFTVLVYDRKSNYWITTSSALAVTSSQSLPFTVNTVMELGLSILHRRQGIEELHLLTTDELDEAGPSCFSLPGTTGTNRRNLVLILMESISREDLLGPNSASVTPFIDSILRNAVVFEQFFADGLSSPQGFDAVMGGLPVLTGESFYRSRYAYNQTRWFPDVLRENGYSTQFYYGVKDRSYSFLKEASFFGVEQNVGFRDLSVERTALDGYYGIYDHIFFPEAADRMKKSRQPFFATLYNVSTHMPFTLLPAKALDTLPSFPKENGKALRYFDNTLRDFFSRIRTETWFSNTLFVFVSDHFSRAADREDRSSLGIFKIPFFIYDPAAPQHREVFTPGQQLDIPITMLSMLGIKGAFFSFGSPLRLDTSYQKNVYLKQGNIAHTVCNGEYLVVDLVKNQVLAYDRLPVMGDMPGRDTVGMDRLLSATRAYWQKSIQAVRENKMGCSIPW